LINLQYIASCGWVRRIRRVYPISIKINGKRLESVVIDPHYEEKYAASITSEPHVSGKMKSFIKPGFKNDKSNGGVTEHPMFPETFKALKAIQMEKSSGLISQWEGRHLEYREIQSAYDRAFKKLGLSYRGTHIMRHGGCRRVYNEEGGDLAVAQQLLGNSDLKSTLVYAKRSASALTEVAEKQWREKENLSKTGDKW